MHPIDARVAAIIVPGLDARLALDGQQAAFHLHFNVLRVQTARAHWWSLSPAEEESAVEQPVEEIAHRT